MTNPRGRATTPHVIFQKYRSIKTGEGPRKVPNTITTFRKARGSRHQRKNPQVWIGMMGKPATPSPSQSDRFSLRGTREMPRFSNILWPDGHIFVASPVPVGPYSRINERLRHGNQVGGLLTTPGMLLHRHGAPPPRRLNDSSESLASLNFRRNRPQLRCCLSPSARALSQSIGEPFAKSGVRDQERADGSGALPIAFGVKWRLQASEQFTAPA
jgi:hypothetical protein